MASAESSFQCPICYDAIKMPTMLYSCEHAFCSTCILKWVQSQDKNATCPFCRQGINLKEKPMIIIKPRYLRFSASNSQNGSSILDLRHELCARMKTVQTLHGDYNQKEAKQKIKLESMDREAENIRAAIKRMETEWAGHEVSLAKTLKSMPNAACFEKVSEAVFGNYAKINATDSYDNIKTRWDFARSQHIGKMKKSDDLANTRSQITQIQKRNISTRNAINEFGPEAFSQRISRETFERLCAVMKWNHQDFLTSTPKPANPLAKKRGPSTQQNKRPSKAPKMSFFKEDLMDMDDDMF